MCAERLSSTTTCPGVGKEWTYPGLVDTLGLCIVPEKGVREMGKTKAPYPAEFKEEAVRLVKSSGKPVAQIARELGV